MNTNSISTMIKELRKKKNYTQMDLAEKLIVSEKTISKWESGRGIPDISLMEPLARALDISLAELFNGKEVVNKNKSANMLKAKFYVCPMCGNIIYSLGEGSYSCCGMELIAQEAEEDKELKIENVENDMYVSCNSPMSKQDYISFFAYVTCSKVQIIKLYPEQNCEARFPREGSGNIYYYNNKNGLFKKRI